MDKERIDRYKENMFLSGVISEPEFYTAIPQRKVWINGKILPEELASVSIYDSTLMFGDMIFEMTRSFHKQHFRLEEHLRRLFCSAKYLKIKIPYTAEELSEAINKLCAENERMMHAFSADDEYRVLINVTRGILPIYLSAGILGASGTSVTIAVVPLRFVTVGDAELFDNGIASFISAQRTISADLLEPKVKNKSRIHYKLAFLEAEDRGKNEWPIMLDPGGIVAEGPGYNVFIVKDGEVLTPKGRNILRGISRDYIFELCEDLGVDCLEEDLSVYDLINADEIFFTATPFCMLPVVSLNGHKIGKGLQGFDFYNYLLEHWGNNVRTNIARQIKSWERTIQ